MINRVNIISKIDKTVMNTIEIIPDQVDRLCLIIHGMQDYKERFLDFGSKLSRNNILVLIPDLRGHGVSNELGYFGVKNGWLNQIHDLNQLLISYQRQYNVPVTMLGHSMGSLFARSYLKRFPDQLSKLVLSGSPAYDRKIKAIIPILKKLNKSPKVSTTKSKILHKVVIGSFNKDYQNPRTDYDWLSVDEQNVDDYINSPYCGFKFTNKAYQDLFELMLDANSPLIQSPRRTKVLIVTGALDPVAQVEKGKVDEIEALLNDWGYQTSQILYPHSRHEILLDIEKELVSKYIIDFIVND